jgi:ribosomal protein S16
MLIKYKHKLKKKSINNIILRLQRKGFLSYPVYSIVIIHKKSREGKGKCLDRIGSYNPNFNERFFFFNSYNCIIEWRKVFLYIIK